jgi:hypothetical protein
MRLEISSELWSNIYFKVRNAYYAIHPAESTSRYVLMDYFASMGVIIKEDLQGSWESVYIVLDEEELTVFLLKWAT